MSAQPVVDGETGEVVEEEGPTVAALAVREPLSSLLEPAADRETTLAAFGRYQELVHDLLKPSDYQSAGRDGKFVKKSGWRKLATAFGVDLEFRSKEVMFEDSVRSRGVLRAEFVYRATAPNGRYADGWAACSAFERCCAQGCRKNHEHCPHECDGWRHFSKPDHDIPATAETRAKNRACSDLFGMGEVSAEEVFGTAGDQAATPTAARAGDAWDTATPAPRGRKATEAAGSKRPAEPAGDTPRPSSGSAGASTIVTTRDGWKADPSVGEKAMTDHPGSVTQQQLKKLGVLAGKFGWDDDERHRQAGIDSWANLSKREGSWLIERWQEAEEVLVLERQEREASAAGTGTGAPPAGGGDPDLLRQAKALYHGTLLTKARMFDPHLRSERDIPDHILRELIESNV